MKNLFKTIIVIFVLCLFFSLSSCAKEDPYIVSAELKSGPTEIAVSTFNYSDYVIAFTYNDGTVVEKTLDDTMISFDDYLKTHHDGDQVLKVTFKNFEYELNIKVARFAFDNVKLVDKTVTYDGKYYSLELQGGYPVETTIFYPNGNSFCNAGTYTITAMLVCDQYATKVVTGKLTIKKDDFDTSKISFVDKIEKYDGTEKEISLTGEGAIGLNVTYSIGKAETNKMVDAGTYEVVAHIDAGVNYNPVKDMKATLTILKGDYNMEQYKFFDKTVVYNGETFTMNITNEKNLPNGVQVYYDGLDVVDAGTYEITASFIGDNINYNPIEPLTAKLTIKKATIELTGVYLDSASFVYDKTAHSIYYTGALPSGITFAGYENNGKIDVGTYTVKANFKYKDQKNYNPITPLEATLEITQAKMTGIVFEDASYEYDGYGHTISVKNLPAGVAVSYSTNGETEPGDYRITASFTYNAILERNYEPLESMTALLSITKKNLASGFEDMEVPYDGTNKMISATIAEEEKDWVSVRYFTYDSTNQEITFTGKTDPGSYLVFAKYVIAPEYQEFYEKYYNQVDRESAILTITKMTYVPVFTNRKLSYTGLEQTVTIDMNEATVHAHLSFTTQYENNKQTDIGYYTGKVKITLSEEAKKYYYSVPDTEFAYAIRGTNKVTFTPTMVGTRVTYDGLPHSIQVKTLPAGISVTYTGNGVTLPGEYSVRATFTCDNDIAKYYYDLDSNFYHDVNGNSYIQARIYIDKQTYQINYNLGPFTYDGTNQVVSVNGVVPWLNVEFEYQEEDRVKPGTYTVTCKPVIKAGTEQEKIYQVNDGVVTFTVVRATAKYTYANQTVKYDGNVHYIKVDGLPEGFDVVTTGDGKISVGTYDVTVKFINNTDCYNDIKDQKTRLIIENNIVDATKLIAFCNTKGLKYISQYDTVKRFLQSKIDIAGLDISFIADYYLDAETPYPDSDTKRHGNSNDLDDFTFAYVTNDVESCIVEFSIRLKEGYVYSTDDIPDVYNAIVQFTVAKASSNDISAFNEIFSNGVTINQGTSLKTFISKYLDTSHAELTYDIKYMTPDGTYPSNLTAYYASGDNNSDYVFNNATWANNYCLIDLKLTSTNGYCFYDGTMSYLIYEKQVKANIAPSTTVDLTLLEDAISDGIVEVDQYTKLEALINKYIDTTNTNVSYVLYDKNMEEIHDVENFVFKDLENYSIALRTEVSDKYVFNDSKNLFTFIASFDVVVNSKETIDFTDFENYMSNIATSVPRYTDFFNEVVPGLLNSESGIIPENSILTWEMVDVDGKITTGSSLTGIVFKNAIKNEANSVSITFKFRPTTGYAILDENMVNVGYKEYKYNIGVTYKEYVPGNIFSDWLSSVKDTTVTQFTDLSTTLASINDVIASYQGLSVKYDIDFVTTNTTRISSDINPSSKYILDKRFNTTYASPKLNITLKFVSSDDSIYYFTQSSKLSYQTSFTLNLNKLTYLETEQATIESLQNNWTKPEYSSVRDIIDDYYTLDNYHWTLNKIKVDLVDPDDNYKVLDMGSKYNYELKGTGDQTFVCFDRGFESTYMIHLFFTFDSGYIMVDSNGFGVTKYEAIYYVTLEPTTPIYVNDIDRNITDVTMKQFDKVTDAIYKAYSIPDYLTVTWELLVNNTVKYSGSMSSTDNLYIHEARQIIRLTMCPNKEKMILVDANDNNISSYQKSFVVNLNLQTESSKYLDAVNLFNDSNKYLQDGKTFADYFNSVADPSYYVEFSGYYTMTTYPITKVDVNLNSKISGGNRYNLTYTVKSSEGSYLYLDGTSPVTEIKVNVVKDSLLYFDVETSKLRTLAAASSTLYPSGSTPFTDKQSEYIDYLYVCTTVSVVYGNKTTTYTDGSSITVRSIQTSGPSNYLFDVTLSCPYSDTGIRLVDTDLWVYESYTFDDIKIVVYDYGYR